MSTTMSSINPGAKTAIPAEVERALAASGLTAACLQCKKCTSGCPVAGRADYPPHRIARMVQLGRIEELLASRVIWECTSCQTCATRCPQKVDVAALNDALRRFSRELGKADRETAVPVFNDIFLGTVCRQGRMYEMGLMGLFKLRTLRFFADLGKFPMMLWKRKLAIVPPFVRGYLERRKLFRFTRDAGGSTR